MKADIAGAPVSFGVFELTPAGAETVAADQMLEALHESGYAGVDLGPLGYLGEGQQLIRRLQRYELELAGGWVQLPFSDDEAYSGSIPELDEALRVFSQFAESSPRRLPLPTLADSGSLRRQNAPGKGADVDALDDQAWARLVRNAGHAAQLVRAAGLEPTFHHHAGTFVESPYEIDRFLAEVDIDLTLDTGHLLIAGGDPVEAIARWGNRINHLHLKDVDVSALDAVLETGGGMREVWSSGAFVAFGRGDIDLESAMNALDERDFDGWVVVEQDVLNGPDVSIEDFRVQRTHDQRINRAALRAWL